LFFSANSTIFIISSKFWFIITVTIWVGMPQFFIIFNEFTALLNNPFCFLISSWWSQIPSIETEIYAIFSFFSISINPLLKRLPFVTNPTETLFFVQNLIICRKSFLINGSAPDNLNVNGPSQFFNFFTIVFILSIDKPSCLSVLWRSQWMHFKLHFDEKSKKIIFGLVTKSLKLNLYSYLTSAVL